MANRTGRVADRTGVVADRSGVVADRTGAIANRTGVVADRPIPPFLEGILLTTLRQPDRASPVQL